MEVEKLDAEESERRRFFRIEDEIILFYKEIGSEEVPDVDGFKEEIVDSFSLSSALNHLSFDSSVLLKKIERTQPEVGDFLKIIEKKIDLISHASLLKDTQLTEKSIQSINISASGLAFDSNHSLETGTILELKLLLPPSLLAMVTYGKVVYCKKTDTGTGATSSYHIGVDFFKLREQDRELLIRHVVKKQIKQIRDEKENS